MRERAIGGIVFAAWASFFVWLLVSGEMNRYIGPRTEWVVVFGAVALTIVSLIFWSLRWHTAHTLGVLVLLVPIAAVVVVPKPSLGSLAASRKLSGGPAVSIRPGPVAAGDEVSFVEIGYAGESEEYATVNGIAEGLEVELTGFVTPSPGGTVDFALTRFSIYCCAADVVPHSVGIVSDRAYPVDAWLNVRGILEERDGAFVVVARSIDEVPEPKDPYIR